MSVNPTAMVNIQVQVFLFEEDGIHHAYSPALELVGTGYTKDEAINSFDITAKEYLKYTMDKQTLIKDLKSHGWKIKANDKFKEPGISDMMKTKPDLADIIENKNFSKNNFPLSLQMA